MVAILPGTDADLADEIVILTAHYDHVGKGRKGVCPGACDNASSVAALLEIAEQMTLADKGPRRSVCFASFDTEERMAFGAFAFTLSKTFKGKKIAAVVNIDMLGRNFLDIIENSLFVVGTENYPQLRAQIMQKAQSNNLQILPLSTELTGPAGDHLAFEHLDIPVLFFSCGYNKDYHATTDTPEKLDYETIKKSADHSKFLVESYRDMEKKVFAKKPNIFQNLDFKYKTCDITHRNISFVQNEQGLYELDILVPKIGLFCKTKGFIFKSGHFVLAAQWTPLFFEGTKEQTVDYCLLQWQKSAADTKYSDSYHKSWARVLQTVTGEQHDPSSIAASTTKKSMFSSF